MQQKKLTFYPADINSHEKVKLASSTILAGFPSPADDFLERELDLNKYLIPHPSSTFFVRVSGTSMEGANIFEDDILIVDRSMQTKNGDIVIAIINGEFTVKRIKLEKNKIFLIPENDNYSNIEITKEMDFEVWGIVTYIIHKAK